MKINIKTKKQNMKFDKIDHNHIPHHHDYDIKHLYEESRYFDTGHIHHMHSKDPYEDKQSEDIAFLKKELYDLHYKLTEVIEDLHHNKHHSSGPEDNVFKHEVAHELEHMKCRLKKLEERFDYNESLPEISYDVMKYIDRKRDEIIYVVENRIKEYFNALYPDTPINPIFGTTTTPTPTITKTTTTAPEPEYVYSIRELNELHNHVKFSYDDNGNVYIKADKEIPGLENVNIRSSVASKQFKLVKKEDDNTYMFTNLDIPFDQIPIMFSKIYDVVLDIKCAHEGFHSLSANSFNSITDISFNAAINSSFDIAIIFFSFNYWA